ncbi:MAG: penicillin acylase family protein [Melioribacteraceae bacterium]|nr:penicillin acylase family protein [Melioribacteraceae bacterium]MCF8394863.1 penicillin acylase family protein [Melioribacteraceae bacterium]MCF8420591.1 penicillin acylase family protein [Melioribacteraceae bacterium]
MKKWHKISIGVVSTIIVLLAAAGVLSYQILTGPVPDYEGVISVNGINKSIKVYRDSFAVPYIIAGNDEDAAYAMGYVHAQERLFQMDLTRRAAAGRLSEVLGTQTLPFDKMFKTIGLMKHVVENYHNYSTISRSLVEAYSKGVNEFIRTHKGNYQIEFDLLGYDPELWKPEHSLVIAKLMAWELNISWWMDIAFTHLLQKFDEEKIREIIPDFPENAPLIIPEGIKEFAEVSTDLIKTDQKFREFMGIPGTHIGSNNWVVNEKKSVSGKPIIANDPHLGFSIPGKWFTAVVKSPNWNVMGFSLPGVPGMVIGKNNSIAWVMTNVMADDADFYVEKFDSTRTKYLLNNEWKDLEFFTDTIYVKDSADVEIDIYSTHRGPVISGIHSYKSIAPNEYQNIADVSMRWTALDFSDEMYAIINANKSKNWKEFENAIGNFTVPGQNFVYADVDGHIGYVCAAKLPIRKNLSPSLVYDGTSSENDWVGFVPYNEMPKLYDPPENFIASANNKTVKDFPYHIGNLWEPPSRIERIVELLTSKNKHSVEDYKKYQVDFYSHHAESITPFIHSAFRDVKLTDKNLKLSLELFENWDFVMDKDSQVPAIFLTFYQNLLRNIFIDEMGEKLFEEYIFIANVPYRKIYEMLTADNSSWFDDITTDENETRDMIIRKSLVDAITELENKLGKNIAEWQWGKIHTITFNHAFNGISPVVDNLVNVGPFPISGDGTTIFNTEYSFRDPYKVKLGPSMRFIVDFAEPNICYFILPTGQSGHIMSSHYNDMTDMWLDGKYLKINTDQDSIENSNYKLFVINPN